MDHIEQEALRRLGIHLVIHYDPIAENEDWNAYRNLVERCAAELSPDASIHDLRIVDYQEQKKAGVRLTPQMISTGLPDIMMPVASLEALDAIAPDFPALSKLSEKYEVVGVHAFTLDCGGKEGETCHVRNFAPLYDIDEEAATGTSNGALTYYGYLNGFIKAGDDCCFVQGEKMGRPSEIRSHIDAGCSVKVGGNAVILAEGEIYI